MKRSRIKNRKWAKRRAPVAKKKPRRKSKHARRPRFVDYMLEVKKLPCAALVLPGHKCSGPVEADHAGLRYVDGDGHRAHDSTVIPLCTLAHRERDAFAGAFKDFNHVTMREWLDGRIAQTQRWMEAHGVPVPREITTAEPIAVGGELTVIREGQVATIQLERGESAQHATERVLAMINTREDGNVDVRHPEGARK